MSSVIVKGMGIPKSCAECRFCVNGFTDEAPMYECACESYENVSVLVDDNGKPLNVRPDWCSLIEVSTPHGRLIDGDALFSEFERRGWFDNRDRDSVAEDILLEMPTIIEAEGSES